MSKYLMFIEESFAIFDSAKNNCSVNLLYSNNYGGEPSCLIEFEKQDVEQVIENLNFELRDTYFITDLKNNLYILKKDGIEKTNQKIDILKLYKKSVRAYEKSDKIRKKEYLKYKGTPDRIVSNNPSLLFPSFRRCKYFSEKDGFCHRFRLHTPSSKGKQPILIFLDGAGSPGYDNSKQMFNFMNLYRNMKKENIDCYVIAPQLSPVESYNSDEFSGFLTDIIKHIDKENGNVDFSRIYLAGISYGGHGVIYETLRKPDVYAGAVEAVGWIYTDNGQQVNYEKYGKDRYHSPLNEDCYKDISKTPFWFACSHIELAHTMQLYNNLKRLGADVKFTRNDKKGHLMFKNFYKNESWAKWLFEKRK
jgi:hypothetical protein